jgi:hypothetical protein
MGRPILNTSSGILSITCCCWDNDRISRAAGFVLKRYLPPPAATRCPFFLPLFVPSLQRNVWLFVCGWAGRIIFRNEDLNTDMLI